MTAVAQNGTAFAQELSSPIWEDGCDGLANAVLGNDRFTIASLRLQSLFANDRCSKCIAVLQDC